MGGMIKIDVREITRLERQMALVSANKPRAIREGLNQGGDKVTTQVRRKLKAETGVKKYQSITSRVVPHKAAVGSARYDIRVSGKVLPIKEFPVRITASGIWAAPWNIGRVFERSFAIGGNINMLRARLTEEREPLRRLYGPNLAKELGKEPVEATFFASVEEAVPPAILARLLKPLRMAPPR